MRFSLKQLLILVTLVAIAVAVSALHRLKLEKQRREWEKEDVYVKLNDDWLWPEYESKAELRFSRTTDYKAVSSKVRRWQEKLDEHEIRQFRLGPKQ